MSSRLYDFHVNLSDFSLFQLLKLSWPYVLFGDMIARHPIGRPTYRQQRANLFKSTFDNISLLNSPTHFHTQTNTYSTIDIDLFIRLHSRFQPPSNWKFPWEWPLLYHLDLTRNIFHLIHSIRYKTVKADWIKYHLLTGAATEVLVVPELVWHLPISEKKII